MFDGQISLICRDVACCAWAKMVTTAKRTVRTFLREFMKRWTLAAIVAIVNIVTIETIGTIESIGYLHLIDRVADKDIDLLRQPTYTFSHSSNQAIADRFLVRLRPEGETGIFAYQNGNSIVVEGTGMLQVFDVMGRQLFTKDINSQFSIFNSQFPTGVYILRLNGKIQKIVIR